MPKLSFKMIPYLVVIVAICVWQDAFAYTAPEGAVSTWWCAQVQEALNDDVTDLSKVSPQYVKSRKAHWQQHMDLCQEIKAIDTTGMTKKELAAIEAFSHARHNMFKFEGVGLNENTVKGLRDGVLPAYTYPCPERIVNEKAELFFRTHHDWTQAERPVAEELLAVCARYNGTTLSQVYKDEWMIQQVDEKVYYRNNKVQIDAKREKEAEEFERLRPWREQQLREMFPSPEEKQRRAEEQRFAAEEQHRQWERRRARDLDFQREQDRYDQQMRDYQQSSRESSRRLDEFLNAPPNPSQQPSFTPGVPPVPNAIPAPPGCRNVNVNGQWFQVC